jgi:hypothetical protein
MMQSAATERPIFLESLIVFSSMFISPVPGLSCTWSEKRDKEIPELCPD